MGKDTIVPAYFRFYPKAPWTESWYDYETKLLHDIIQLELPYKPKGSTYPIRTLPSEFKEAMMYNITCKPDVLAVILLNLSYIFYVRKNRIDSFKMYGTEEKSFVNTHDFSDNYKFNDSLLSVGFIRTPMLSNNLYTGISRILYDKGSNLYFYKNDWIPNTFDLQVTNKRDHYISLMDSTHNGVLYTKEDKLIYLD